MKLYEYIIIIALFIIPSVWVSINSGHISNIYDLFANYTDDRVTQQIEDEVNSLSGKMLEIREHIDYVQQEVSRKSNARIYSLEITICLLDEEADEIYKRKVRMDNIIALNPSVSALYVDTWLGYGEEIEIPTIYDKERQYACWIKILSIR